MLRPKLLTLAPGIVDQIIDEAIALLGKPGVRVHNQEALVLLADAGAHVTLDTQIAYITEELVEAALQSTPHEFYLYDILGERAVYYGGDHVHFDPGSAGITVLNGNSGEQRLPTTEDFVAFVKLVESLPQIDAQSTSRA